MAERDDESDLPGAGYRTTDAQPVIISIGASAGGIEALQAFFDEMPPDTGAAFVVIVHLDPSVQSNLAEILGNRTMMRVIQVQDSTPLEVNSVYVIPPDRRLQIKDHRLSADYFEEARGYRAPIDSFFRSHATRLGDGFAVILSGAGSDGAIGVRAVKEAGGIILVQDPVEAQHPSMPRAAIATGVVDVILPVRNLASRLAELVRNKDSLKKVEFREQDEERLRRIFAHLRVRTGHDFTRYKRSTVLRRLARRVQVTRSDGLAEYYDYLRENADEAQALLADLLISVTTFFRDGEAFETLRTLVVPQLFRKEATDTIRVWVPGCATGEEAYSIAVLLVEENARQELRRQIQVFGSDLDARALNIAREGRYPLTIEVDLGEERLRRFFVKEGDGYRVRQELRDLVLFAGHSLLKDPPFSRVDLISCRNVLIYLDRELHEQVCSTFHYALNPGGFLFLGSSETADNPPGLFRPIDRNTRIYQSTVQPGDRPRLLPRLLSGVGIRDQIGQLARPPAPGHALIEAAHHRRAIERVAPPSILVDDTHRVLHLSENAGRYVQPTGGPLSGDVVDLIRPELRFELRTALHRAFEQGEATLSLAIPVRFNGHPVRVHVHVKPLAETTDAEAPTAIVMFIEGEAIETVAGADDSNQAAGEVVRRLREELDLVQARLRTTQEESEAANEELRAANEELQSINEEYRSTSEELETSKEELQSINEELQTVNSELKLKLDTVSRAHSDLQNLIAATDVGTLFLDARLRIKRFTDRMTDLFSVTASDEGRPITDFAHQLDYDDLTRDALRVLTDLAPIRREVKSRHDHWFDLRIRPYRTIDDKIDGVVLTFVDITERLRVEEALRDSERRHSQQKHLVELSHEPIFLWDFDGGILEWNRGSQELYGYSAEEALGKDSARLLATAIAGSSIEERRARLREEGSWSGEVTQKTKGGREVVVESRLELESFDGRRLVLESSHDITERKLWEQRQKLLLGELTHRVKNTLAVVQAIAHQTLRTSPSPEEFGERFDGRLQALARAHGLLVESDWAGADLSALARQQLAAHLTDGSDRVTIGGDPVTLPADLATPFGLVLHELATNAVKHGSLSNRNGTVTVGWTLTRQNGNQRLKMTWSEKGGPRVKAPESTGLGTTLIESAIPGATISRKFATTGFVCTIELDL